MGISRSEEALGIQGRSSDVLGLGYLGCAFIGVRSSSVRAFSSPPTTLTIINQAQ